VAYYYLTPVLGGPGAPRYAVTEKAQMIGRSESADVALLEPTVSREHAEIQIRDGAVYLQDLGSKHGTFVNSKRITAARLKTGDIVVFGLSLVLRLEQSDVLVSASADEQNRENPTISIPDAESARHNTVSVSMGLRRPSRATEGLATGDAEQLKMQLIKTRKLAAIGAHCAARLPELYGRLQALIEAIQHGRVPGGLEGTSKSLVPIVADLAQLLESNQLKQPMLEPTSLFDVVRRAVATIRPEIGDRNVDLLVGVSAEIQVIASPARLTSAVVELLRNAAAVTPHGGAVEISATSSGGVTELVIVDGGKGIAPEQMARIFDPFVTLNEDLGPLGLGLFEVRQIVASFGGTFFLEANAGLGTRARICLRSR
jgi:signal transduction histidine kinase